MLIVAEFLSGTSIVTVLDSASLNLSSPKYFAVISYFPGSCKTTSSDLVLVSDKLIE